MTARIRRAVPRDADRVTEIARAAKASWGYPSAWLAAWEQQLTITPAYLDDHLVVVAEVDGVVVGIGALAEELDHWGIDHLWIDPATHRQGIGRAIFEELVKLAAAKPLPVRIESDPHAVAFYERMGAVRIGSVPAPTADAPDRRLPLLELAPTSR
ncbi:MAG TPA: GNAT family N-acetyltransferase [Acidimicrobiia bacterium]|jgi:ribosomal protein S18 acetylase RimI-like enzyme